jgi:hypothetical protein
MQAGAFFKVVLFCCFILSVGCANNKENEEVEHRRTLPEFSFENTLGRKIESNEVRNRYTYIQFLRFMPGEKDEEIFDFYLNFRSSNNVIILFITSENRTPQFYTKTENNLFFIYDKDNSIKAKFRSPLCCDNFLIYNKRHELMHQGILNNNLNKEIKPFLLEILNDPTIEYFDYRYKLSKIERSGLPIALTHDLGLASGEKPYHFVALLSKICSECSSGLIISHLNRSFHKAPHPISYTILLSEDYSDVDLKNLKDQLQIDMPLEIGSPQVIDLWSRLKSDIPIFFNNIFLILDSHGTVKGFLDEDNPDIFYSSLEKLIARTDDYH